MLFMVLIFLISLLSTFCVYADDPTNKALISSTIGPMLINQKGQSIGRAKLYTTDHGSLVSLTVCNLSPGWHAVHLHEEGKCNDYLRGFKQAKDIFNPRKVPHGIANSQSKRGYSLGSLANVYVSVNSCAQIEQLIPNLDKRVLRSHRKGIALIIHEFADDYKTQPHGEAGERLACAVLIPR